jgi:hypothetical protein
MYVPNTTREGKGAIGVMLRYPYDHLLIPENHWSLIVMLIDPTVL